VGKNGGKKIPEVQQRESGEREKGGANEGARERAVYTEENRKMGACAVWRPQKD